jgi:hypothetical protein
MPIQNYTLLISCFVLVSLVLGTVIGLLVYEILYKGPQGNEGSVGDQGFEALPIPLTTIEVSSIVTNYFSLASGAPIVFFQNNYTRIITANFVLTALVVVPSDLDIPLLALPFITSSLPDQVGAGKLFNTTDFAAKPGNLFFTKSNTTNVSIQTASNWFPNDRVAVTFFLCF